MTLAQRLSAISGNCQNICKFNVTTFRIDQSNEQTNASFQNL